MFAPLTVRASAANDLWECFDTERLASGDAAAPIVLPAVEIDEADVPDLCRPGGQKPSGHDVLEWAAASPVLRRFGARATDPRDTLYGLGAYLDRHGLGRIRRARR